MSVVVLPRKIIGALFCIIGGAVLITGVFGDSSRNGGPIIAILLGSLFTGIGWMSIKSTSRTRASLDEQNGSAAVRSAQRTSIPAGTSVGVPESGGGEPVSQLPSNEIQEQQAPERPRRSASEIGTILAETYHSVFKTEAFHEYFGSSPFANNQTVDHALAEWHAFGAFTYSFCLWRVYEDQDQVFGVLDVFQPKLFRTLNLNEATRKRFLEIVENRENQYLSAYQRISNGADMAQFYGKVVSRITGAFDPALDELQVPQIGDAEITSGLSRYHTVVMAETKKLIERLRQ